MASEAGKGSARRPSQVPTEVVDANFDRIFRNGGRSLSGGVYEAEATALLEPPQITERPEHIFDPYLTINS